MFLAISHLHFPLRVGRTLLKHEYFSLSRTITTTPIRTNIFNIGKRIRHETFYKKVDKVDPDFELIYRAPFEYLTAFSKHVPTLSLITVSTVALYKLSSGIDIIDLASEFTLGPAISDSTEMIAFGVAFYLFNFVLLYAVSQYPLRIYRNKTKYIAMFEGHLPFSAKKFFFGKGDVQLSKKNFTPWHESIYKMKNKSVLLFPHHFKRPSDFNALLKKN